MKQQRGFTLIEMVVVLGIVAAVVMTIVMTITTLMLNSQKPSTQQTLLQQVKNAGYWIPRDIQMSSNVTLRGTNGFPFTVNIPVENYDYTVDYLFVDGNTLVRQQYNNFDILTAETLIAQYVDIDNTTCDNVTEDLYKLTIRVSLGEESVTASYGARYRLAVD